MVKESDEKAKRGKVKTKDLPLDNKVTDKDLKSVKGGKKKPAKK